MTALAVDNLVKIYGDSVRAVDDVSFSVKAGEKVILIGHNGSGKSTVFRCLTGIDNASEGRVKIAGQDIVGLQAKALRPIRKKIGVVFQSFNLIKNVSVFQNVLFGAMGSTATLKTFSAFASDALREKAMLCLARVNLAAFASRRADELSGGQKQRVAIARMLMQDPEIILADEPIAALDPKAGREVMDLLWDVANERNLALIVVLHQMDIVKQYGERIIALKAGQIVADTHISQLDNTFFEALYEADAELEGTQPTDHSDHTPVESAA